MSETNAPPAYSLERPGEGAEDMFADDPWMLEAVRKARAQPDPVAKPWWWTALLFFVGFGLAGASGLAYLAMTGASLPHPLAPLSGLLAGTTLFTAAVGFRPGTFRISGTETRLTLWKPLDARARALFAAGALVVLIGGPALAMADPSNAPTRGPGARPSPPAAPSPPRPHGH